MSNNECNDIAFGEMTYQHRWIKKGKLSVFGKEWNINVVARANLGEKITKEQQDNYKNFLQNNDHYIQIIESELIKYVNENIDELSEYWSNARQIENKENLSEIVTPKTLLFKRDGSTVLLLDCVWDEENGIGIQVIPKIMIGVQDLFL